MSRSRQFCFTLNNYNDQEFIAINEWPCNYLVVGKEKGASGTPHLQGYVCFKDNKTLSAAKKLQPRAHWEVTVGTPLQASEYCKKEGDFVQRGTLPMSQKEKGLTEKNRWSNIINLSEAGDWDALKREHPDVYVRDLKKLEYIHSKRPRILETLDGDMPHQWLVGPPGSGKSKTARDENPGAYIKDPQSKWWDGYNGEAVVVIDDFDKYQKAQGGDIKRWLDRYSFQAETKGGQTLIRPNKIIITSNYSPGEIWDDPVTVAAIERRVTIRTFGEPPIYPMFVSGFNPKN